MIQTLINQLNNNEINSFIFKDLNKYTFNKNTFDELINAFINNQSLTSYDLFLDYTIYGQYDDNYKNFILLYPKIIDILKNKNNILELKIYRLWFVFSRFTGLDDGFLFDNYFNDNILDILQNNPYINSLQINNINLHNSNFINYISNNLLSNCYLNDLNLYNSNLNNDDYELLFNSLYQNNYITSLNLGLNYFNNDILFNLCNLLNNTSNITSLNLSGISQNYLNETSSIINFKILYEFLKTNKSITNLNLSYNDIIDINELCNSLKYNNSLIELNLSNNKINNINYLFDILINNQSLTSLNIKENNLNINEYKKELNVLLNNNIILTNLII